ncbi:uncharacterized protein BYT42DRAFT_580720 [Radiomyces spectabilis]|uniref:uncharacterized protein n=1 Tax=Radiomyces spectabilis TaxID=64574 RepID=UPI00222096E9|nr:uncharacterized protein BYT42DRAFT_580720 [Radiomyces spectabilis]KAI8371565.1 hypothetical protein BYT42DRAFT_580720 [Radiomyces spectabilis]
MSSTFTRELAMWSPAMSVSHTFQVGVIHATASSVYPTPLNYYHQPVFRPTFPAVCIVCGLAHDNARTYTTGDENSVDMVEKSVQPPHEVISVTPPTHHLQPTRQRVITRPKSKKRSNPVFYSLYMLWKRMIRSYKQPPIHPFHHTNQHARPKDLNYLP